MSEAEELEELIAHCPNLHSWKIGDPISPFGIRLLIGLAPWSVEDRTLLNQLKHETSKQPISIRIEVFFPEGDLDRYIPSLNDVYLTPFIGVWINGTLTDKKWGIEARKYVQRVMAQGFVKEVFSTET